MYAAKTWTLGKLVRNTWEVLKCGTCEGWSWTGRVRKEEVLQRVKDERNILQTIKRRKANWIGHILRNNCLIQHVIKVKIGERT